MVDWNWKKAGKSWKKFIKDDGLKLKKAEKAVTVAILN
jgi:hypothetical protein